MDFSLSDEQRALKESLRRYCERHWTLPMRLAAVRAGGSSRERWAAYVQQGWLDPLLPADAGGSETGWVELAIIAEELGRKLALESLLPAVLCATLIEQTAADERRCDLLKSLAGGNARFAFAHDEPHAPSSIAPPITTELHRRCGALALSGRKTRVFAGAEADRLLVSARECVDGTRQRLRLLLIDARASGVQRSAYQLLDGTAVCELTFSDIHVTADDLLGDEVAIERALNTALDYATLYSCAEAVGAMSEALSLTRDHLRTRRQYGAPLSTLQALQHRMADMYAEAELSRSILYAALSAIDASRSTRELHVSAAKMQIATAAAFVAASALQLHGGMGMTEEHPIGHYFKKLTVLQALFGRRAAHAARVADHVLAPAEA